MDIRKILEDVLRIGASDLFIIAGSPCAYKKDKQIIKYDDYVLKPKDSEDLIRQIYDLTINHTFEKFIQEGDDDFSFSLSHVGRFRVNTYKQRNSLAAVLRIVKFELPDYKNMHIPEIIIDLYKQKKGLVLVTGPAGSGKSTTLACIIDKINHTRNTHIITIEDPIEFLYSHNLSLVSQREISNDTKSYSVALRASLREAPEVILIGELRDLETIETAVTAAETGHLLFSSLHTTGSANTIERIIDVFPPNQQQQIRFQLSMVLNAVVSQQLVPDVNGKMIPVFEIMFVNQAIRTLIRDGKTHQIENVIMSSRQEGMITNDEALIELYNANQITKETAIAHATNQATMSKKIR
jgi:twitching motility protein PilT